METLNQEGLDNKNISTLKSEILWFRQLLESRMRDFDDVERTETLKKELKNPLYEDGYYAQFINKHVISFPDRVLLLSLLLPEIYPAIFLIKGDNNQPINFIEYVCHLRGLAKSKYPWKPDLYTVLLILSGGNTNSFVKHRKYFKEESFLFKNQIVLIDRSQSESGQNIPEPLVLASEYIDFLLHGSPPRPDFGKTFPASLITTKLNWEDLVVDDIVMGELQRISRWNLGSPGMLERSEGRINGAFPCLFHGPSGNGKTLAAQLLGKHMGVDVFKIDLSMAVSKYIGETEKNLATLFDRARNKNWILFFDEADSLFGKRTNISDSKDKWANLEMSYLLQRMEEHKGLTILATNHKGNLDQALTRRFQASVHFPRPDAGMRKQLWKKLMPEPYFYDEIVNIDFLAKFDLTGASIANCIKAACLEAECKNQLKVEAEDLKQAIMREFQKEGRSWT